MYDIARVDKETGKEVMFDNILGRWVPYEPEWVPWTYSMATAPKNVSVELDYFVRSTALVNHKFIWAMDQIPINVFEKLKSRTNHDFIGRFVIKRWYPTVLEPGRAVGQFIERDQDEYIHFHW